MTNPLVIVTYYTQLKKELMKWMIAQKKLSTMKLENTKRWEIGEIKIQRERGRNSEIYLILETKQLVNRMEDKVHMINSINARELLINCKIHS
jgi:hypothetical protein